jgi:hypothetical protein
LPQFATLPRTPSTLPMLSLQQSMLMAKAFRRMDAFCVTFSMKDSMLTRKGGSRSTVFLPKLRERAVAALTTVSPSLLATRSPPRRFSLRTDVFPFTDQSERDPITGETGGLLDRAVTDKVVPRIFFSNTSYKYWGRAAALIHVSADGKKDAPISDTVRI